MLRITTETKSGTVRFKLEGRLAGPWVKELLRCWGELAGPQRGHAVVDLAGVTFIDPKGKTLLTQMWQHGATFHAVGCLTRSIVEEITKGKG